MQEIIILRYLHFIAIFGVVSAIVSEHLLVKDVMTRKEIKRVLIIDRIYGVSAIIVLAAGFALWFWVGKPAEFYSKNGLFHTKVTLFVVVGILSIYPSIFFAKNRKGNPEEEVELPKKIKMMLRLELLLVFIIPLLATMMAQGVGYSGE
ncbi:MAG: DUF2214 family protein [Bacteroidota bacterium]